MNPILKHSQGSRIESMERALWAQGRRPLRLGGVRSQRERGNRHRVQVERTVLVVESSARLNVRGCSESTRRVDVRRWGLTGKVLWSLYSHWCTALHLELPVHDTPSWHPSHSRIAFFLSFPPLTKMLDYAFGCIARFLNHVSNQFRQNHARLNFNLLNCSAKS